MKKRLEVLSYCALALVLAAAASLTACGEARSESAGEVAEAGAEGGEPSFFERWFQEERTVTVPAGTLLVVSFNQHLSSRESAVGQTFSARVVQGVSVAGDEVIPAGSRVLGNVTEARQAKIGGRSRLSLDFHSLELPDGESLPIAAAFSRRGKSERAKDAAIIGGSTLGGAILGEAIDEGEGTLVGAVVGGIGGALAAKKTKGQAVEIPAGATMSLELTQPIEVEIVTTGRRATS